MKIFNVTFSDNNDFTCTVEITYGPWKLSNSLVPKNERYEKAELWKNIIRKIDTNGWVIKGD